MKMQFLTVAAAALMAAPMLYAQGTPTPVPTTTSTKAPRHMGPRRGHGGMMKDLNLSADQQARMKAIHTKYAAQMKSSRAASKPDMDAMKAARAKRDTATMRSLRTKMRSDMAPTMKLRQQEMKETRAVLTADQQQKLDARRSQMKARMSDSAGRAWRGKRPPRPAKPAMPIQPVQPMGAPR